MLNSGPPEDLLRERHGCVRHNSQCVFFIKTPHNMLGCKFKKKVYISFNLGQLHWQSAITVCPSVLGIQSSCTLPLCTGLSQGHLSTACTWSLAWYIHNFTSQK